MGVRKYGHVDCRQMAPGAVNANGFGQASGSTGAVNYVNMGDLYMHSYHNGTSSDVMGIITADANSTDGWQVPSDNADNEGAEFVIGAHSYNDNGRAAFTVGTDPAFEWSITMGIPDVSDYDFVVFGWRKAEDFDTSATIISQVGYSDMFTLSMQAGDIYTVTNLNSAGQSSTDTTDNWADDDVKTLTFRVSAAGVATALIDGSAPTTEAAFTFDDGDVVIPFFRYCKGSGVASDTPPIVQKMHFGYQ